MSNQMTLRWHQRMGEYYVNLNDLLEWMEDAALNSPEHREMILEAIFLLKKSKPDAA